ncbi:MAG: helix-hairpin-helix domain-containing protein [Candidatus Thiothrix singaporensis]|uniref:Helix-hairpin-helix domain-containing protein n=1 Tax=Candidatus Thiothrix singaporensis TaxID=2799669 RepID=A0A7L6AYQ0_9GAMM|nr:MAG: helix-hairpin-helix domain-containing protein [Candidatus Thiothrix singaporensis]
MAGSLVNINKADAAALDTLDGIGSKKAEAIVAYRTEHGEFKTLEELKEVPGIGEGIYKKIEKDISLADDVAAASATPEKRIRRRLPKMTPNLTRRSKVRRVRRESKAIKPKQCQHLIKLKISKQQKLTNPDWLLLPYGGRSLVCACQF